MLQRLVGFCVDNPLRVALAAVVTAALGALAWRSIPLEYLYDPSPPQLVVVLPYPGAPADVVSANVTTRVESELRSVPGVRRLLSRSADGSASLTIDFDRSLRFEAGERQVRERVGRLRYQLPRELREPQIFQVGGGNDQAVLEFAVTADGQGLAQASDWVASVARPRIEAVSGVGDLSIAGDAPRQLEIHFEPARAAALGVSLEDVVVAVQRENVEVRTGWVRNASQQRMLRVAGRLEGPADFERIAVRADGPMLVRLGDVARLREGAGEPVSLMRWDGRDTVSVKVFPLPGAHVAAVSERVREALAELQRDAPAGLKLDTVVDNSEYARASLAAVQRAMIEGAALTVLLVALCLRSIRSSFITALTLPLSVLSAVACLWVLGASLNLFTLLALTLAIGVLIDDAIVVRENIVRHLHEGATPAQAALQGTLQLSRAVASTTLVIAVVFLPLLMAGGPLGPFLRQFGITVALAVTLSLIVSLTLDPALSVLLGRQAISRPPQPRAPGRLLRGVQQGLAVTLRRPGIVALAALALAAGGVALFRSLPSELLPEFDEAIATLDVQLPVGSAPAYLQAKARQVEAAVREFPEIEHLMLGVGTPRAKHQLTLFMRLVPPEQRQRGFRDVEDALRERLGRIAGVSTASTSRPVNILVSGPDDAQLERLRQEILKRLAAVKGLDAVVSSDVEANQALVVAVHRDRLADAGGSLERLAGALGAFVSGSPIGTWQAPNGRPYDIAVRFPGGLAGEAAGLANLEIAVGGSAQQGLTPLRAFADIRVGDRPRLIERVDGKRVRRVLAAVSGRPLGEVLADVRAAVAGIPVPAGHRVELGGKLRELEASQADFMVALALAALLVFCVLAMFFGGLVPPLVIMATIPLGAVGALGWLAATGGTLNVFSGVGLLLVCGLVAKNGILIVDFARQAEAEGQPRTEALRLAVAHRLRPILMTSGAMMIGMLPIAFGMGHGGEQLAAMGQAIVSGVAVSTLLSLVVVPALYALLPHRTTAQPGPDDWKAVAVGVNRTPA